MTTVSVIGLGYIGLPTASLLASGGHRVYGIDVNREIVETVNSGRIHIYEPDLEMLVRSAIQSGNLTAHLKPVAAEVHVIAVPTPFRENHIPDVSYIEMSVEAMAPVLRPGDLVILESTSPIGTVEMIAERVKKLRPELNIPIRGAAKKSGVEQLYFAHCPERVLPGHILRELIENDRIVGGIDPASSEKARAFYSTFVRGKILLTDCRTAELTKLVENSYRDVNIAFANELSRICEKLEVNVWETISLANHHPRVKILSPGPGVGGHCIAVDPWFIVDAAREEARLIRTAREVNDHMPHHVVGKVRSLLTQGGSSSVVACLGLAYKPDIDDLRESPSVEIVKELAETGARVIAVEPHVKELPKSLKGYSNVTLENFENALKAAQIVVLLVDHKAFGQVSPAQLAGKEVVDTRGMWRSILR